MHRPQKYLATLLLTTFIFGFHSLGFSADDDSLVVTDSGNVGIGTTDPDARLHVVDPGTQSTSFTGLVPGTLRIYGGNYAVNGYTNLDFSNRNTRRVIGRIGIRNNGSGSNLTFGTSNNYASGITNEALVINHLGNVGIGTTNPQYKLDVQGGPIRVVGTTYASDIRWKENIQTLDNAVRHH